MQPDSSGKGKPIYWLSILGVFYVSQQLRAADSVVHSMGFIQMNRDYIRLQKFWAHL